MESWAAYGHIDATALAKRGDLLQPQALVKRHLNLEELPSSSLKVIVVEDETAGLAVVERGETEVVRTCGAAELDLVPMAKVEESVDAAAVTVTHLLRSAYGHTPEREKKRRHTGWHSPACWRS